MHCRQFWSPEMTVEYKIERQGTKSSGNVVGSNSNVTRLNSPPVPHAVKENAIHLQVVSQGTEDINFHNAEMAMH
jgi:hypothetical protein